MKTRYFQFFITLLACAFFIGCYKDDVSILYSREDKLEKEVDALQSQMDQINGNIDAATTIINSHLSEDHLVSVEALPNNAGYNMLFSVSGVKTVYNGSTPVISDTGTWIVGGKDTGIRARGRSGSDGTDGSDLEIGDNGNWYLDGVDTGVKAEGENGTCPVIGIAKDPSNPSDPNYYWTQKVGTARAAFILNRDGQKIRASGTAGATPVIGIKQDTDMEYYWTVAVPPAEATWLLTEDGKKVKATGQQGAPGDSLFARIDLSDPASVTFVLASDPDNPISVPRYNLIKLSVGDTPITFSEFNQTQTLDFTTSANVVSILAYGPDGWSTEVDMTARTLTVTSPSIANAYAQRSGVISVIAYDNKGMATSVSFDVEINSTINVAIKTPSGTAFTELQVPFQMRLYYANTGDAYNGALDFSIVSPEILQDDGIVNTNKENATAGWAMIAVTEDPNVTFDNYNAIGGLMNLTNIEAALKPDAVRTGYYMPLASNNLNMWWQKATLLKGASYVSPMIIKEKNIAAQVTINLTQASTITVPGVPTPDPTKFWVVLEDQGRACQFNTGAIATATHATLLPNVGLTPAVRYSAGTDTVTTGAFGTFGTRTPSGYAGPRVSVWYDNTPVQTVTYGSSDYRMSAGKRYQFDISPGAGGTLSVGVMVDGWKWVEQTSSW